MGPTAQFGENRVYRISEVVGTFNSISPPPVSPRSVPLTPVSSFLFLSFIKCLWSGGLLFFFFFSDFENSFWLVDFRTASALNFSLLFWINTVLQVFCSFPFWGTNHCIVLYYIFISELFENGTHAMHVNILPPLGWFNQHGYHYSCNCMNNLFHCCKSLIKVFLSLSNSMLLFVHFIAAA